MTFVWDAAKSMRNLAQRGCDFEFAAQIFASQYVEFDDTRRNYGERRVVALGTADGFALTVVFTDRVDPSSGRLISARLSNRKERRLYAEALEVIRDQDEPDEGAR